MFLFIGAALQRVVAALSSAIPSKVLVTGASGKTGRLVFQALLENPKFDPKALVRSDASGKSLRKAVPETGLDRIVVCDVTELDDDTENGVPPGLAGIDAMIICTSAMPRISKMSLVKAFIKAPFNIIRGKKAVDFRSLKFVWKKGQYPEKVSRGWREAWTCVEDIHVYHVRTRNSFAVVRRSQYHTIPPYTHMAHVSCASMHIDSCVG